MSYSAVDRLLVYAIGFIEDGNHLKANLVLDRALKYAPLDANIWYLKAFTHSHHQMQKHALRIALMHDPSHKLAKQKYRQITTDGSTLTLDDFEAPIRYVKMRNYHPSLAYNSQGYLYSLEQDEKRRQRRNLSALLAIGGFIVVIVLFLAVWINTASPNEIIELASLPTGYPTNTPTRTPTITYTPTSTDTPGPSPTPTLTLTSTPSNTPTPTLSPDDSLIRQLYLNITHAEYSNSLDKIIAISDEPAQLHIIDPITYSYESNYLPDTALAMSVSPDGTHVVIGHFNQITHVDLESNRILNNFEIVGQVSEIIYREDNTAVFLVADDSLTSNLRIIRLLDVNDGTEIVQSEINDVIHSMARHPDGLSIYGLGNELFLLDINPESITIANRAVGQYDQCSSLSFSNSGDSLYVCDLIFDAFPGDDGDLRYNASLNVVYPVAHEPQSGQLIGTNVIYTTSLSGVEQYWSVNVWDDNSFELLETVPLPYSIVNGEFELPNPQWIFINSLGTEFYMLLSTLEDNTSQTLNEDQITQGFGTGIISGSLTRGQVLDQFSDYELTRETDIVRRNFQIETAYHFNDVIIDIDYTQALDDIVYVTSHPHQLHILNPETLEKTIIDLARLPLAISITANGLSVVVAQDGLITYIDLETATIIDTYDISARVLDAVISDDGWLFYAYSEQDRSQIDAINLTTGELFQQVYYTFQEKNIFYIQSSTGHVYIANGFSPNLRNTVELFTLYRTGECHDMWFISSGERYVDSCGRIIRTNAISPASNILGILNIATRSRNIADITDVYGHDQVIEIQQHGNVIHWDIENYTRLSSHDLRRDLAAMFISNVNFQTLGNRIFVNSSAQYFYTIVMIRNRDSFIEEDLKFEEYYLFRGEINEDLTIIPYEQD